MEELLDSDWDLKNVFGSDRIEFLDLMQFIDTHDRKRQFSCSVLLFFVCGMANGRTKSQHVIFTWTSSFILKLLNSGHKEAPLASFERTLFRSFKDQMLKLKK